MSVPTLAQTTSSAYEPELNSMVMESTVNLSDIKVPASSAASLAPLAAIVGSGAVELRSRVDTYDPIGRTFRTTLFLAPPGSPKPTDPSNLPALTDATMVSQSVLRVESIYHLPGTPLAIMLTGRFLSSGGSLTVPPGTPYTTSFTYPNDAISATGDTAATFGELSFVIPGQFNFYASSPVGWIIVTPAPVAAPTAPAPPSSISSNHKKAN